MWFFVIFSFKFKVYFYLLECYTVSQKNLGRLAISGFRLCFDMQDKLDSMLTLVLELKSSLYKMKELNSHR